MKKLFAVALLLLALPLVVLAADDPQDEEAQRLLETQQKLEVLQKQMQQFQMGNSVVAPPTAAAPGNPAAPGVNATGVPGLDLGNTKLPINMGDIQSFLNHPWVQKFLKAIGSQDFFPNINKIKEDPNLKNLLFAQLGFIVFMMIFRLWRQSAAETWIGKLWVTLYCAVIFWVVSLYVLPAYLLGEPYRKLCQLLWNTFTQ